RDGRRARPVPGRGRGPLPELTGEVIAPAIRGAVGRHATGVHIPAVHGGEGHVHGERRGRRCGESVPGGGQRVAAPGAIHAQVGERRDPVDRRHRRGTKEDGLARIGGEGDGHGSRRPSTVLPSESWTATWS